MNVFYQIRDQILLKGRERGEVRAGQADSGGHHNIDPPGQVTQNAIEVEGQNWGEEGGWEVRGKLS